MKSVTKPRTPALVLATALLAAAGTTAWASEPRLPIVFVHGAAGSAAQYQTQAKRFASNGYPNLVTGIDRTSSVSATLNPMLDAFFDGVMAETGDTQIYVVAHSLGTSLMNNYLNSAPARAARVAKYVAIDGSAPNCGAIATTCINITAASMNQGHTESVTSPESFATQYAFFTGEAPATAEILPEPDPRISGRLILFPDNVGVNGATVDLWEISGTTGHRIGATPAATFSLGADGAFGPVAVDGRKHYEFSATSPASALNSHYYLQPFIRSDHLIRLLSSPPGSTILTNTAVGPDHAAAVLLRYREWWANQGASNDTMYVTTTSPTWDDDPVTPTPPSLNVLQDPASAPRTSNKIGAHIHDAGSDKVSTLAPIPFFVAQVFQTGVDIWMPATEPPDGTISFHGQPRGDTTRPQVINVPNWASDVHRIVVQFNDHTQDTPPAATATPDTKDQLKCQTEASKNLGKFVTAKTKCVTKCLVAARKSGGSFADCLPPYGGATAACILDPAKGAEAKARGKIAKACAKDCPGCYAADGNCPDGASLLADAAAEIDTVGPLVFCVEAGGGRPSKQEAKCEDGVSKQLVKFVGAKNKCFAKCVTNAFQGKIDVAGCEQGNVTDSATRACIAKVESKATAAIDKSCAAPKGAVPACHVFASGARWVAAAESGVDRQTPDLFCGGAATTSSTTTTTTTSTTTTSSSTTSTTQTTTTTSTTTTTEPGSPSGAFLAPSDPLG
ncbi:MAG: hypothetical protein KIT14_17185 [bacterium]|nr:hypothetical protein [bacterium]